MTPREKEIRAAEAGQLLDNSLLREAFDKIERDAIEAALRAENFDSDPRIADAQRIRVLERASVIRDVRRTLETILMDGTAAQRPRGAVV
jgi:hypothetical protein